MPTASHHGRTRVLFAALSFGLHGLAVTALLWAATPSQQPMPLAMMEIAWLDAAGDPGEVQPETVQEAAPPEPIAESVPESAPETVREPEPEQRLVPPPEPVLMRPPPRPRPPPEPIPEPIPEPTPEPTPEPIPEPEPPPEPEPVVESEPPPEPVVEQVVMDEVRPPEPEIVERTPESPPAPVEPVVMRPPPRQAEPEPPSSAPPPVPVTLAREPAAVQTPAVAAAPARQTAPVFDAAYLHNPRPGYPRMSRRLGEQGLVELRVRVTHDGRAAEVKLQRSSGSARLDGAAQEAVRRWRFVPARRGNVTVEAWVVVPIEFKLEV